MFALILIVVWLSLCLLFFAGSLFLQGYFNESPPSLRELSWRGPSAGSLVALFVTSWVLLATGNPDRYAPLMDFSARQEFPPYKRMTLYLREQPKPVQVVLSKNAAGQHVYRDPRTNGEIPATLEPVKVEVDEDGKTVVFEPKLDSKGKPVQEAGGRVTYRDADGRVMEKGYLGQVTRVHGGWMFGYAVLNVLHFAVWLGALWLLMRFSLGQSIVLSIAAWFTMTLVVMPLLLRQAQTVYERRQKEKGMEQGEAEKPNGRENVAVLPPVDGASIALHSASRPSAGLATDRPLQHYLAAVVAAKSSFTATSWPARTLTRSVRTSPFNSAFSV